MCPPKKWPIGSKNGHFWPKTSNFGQKWRFFSVQNFFDFFLFQNTFQTILNHCQRKTINFSGSVRQPFLRLFRPQCTRGTCPDSASQLRYLFALKQILYLKIVPNVLASVSKWNKTYQLQYRNRTNRTSSSIETEQNILAPVSKQNKPYQLQYRNGPDY